MTTECIFHVMDKIKVDSIKINSSSYVPILPELKFTTTSKNIELQLTNSTNLIENSISTSC